MARRLDFRQHIAGNVQFFKDFIVPLKFVNIVQHRAGRIAVVGNVHLALGKVPHEPCVDVAKEELALFRLCPRTGYIFQNPADFCAGKIGVNDEAGFFLDFFVKALCFKGVAVLGGTAALPNDGIVHRLAGIFFPHNRRLTLVGDADCGNIFRVHAGAGFCLGKNAELARPDFYRVMLDPAWFGENLRKLFLSRLNDVAVLVKNDGA